MAEKYIFRGVNSIKFNQRFKDDNDCLIYLSNLKWEDGYECKRFGNDKFSAGKKPQKGNVQNVIMMKVLLQLYFKS
jgi:hypothetical protein